MKRLQAVGGMGAWGLCSEVRSDSELSRVGRGGHFRCGRREMHPGVTAKMEEARRLQQQIRGTKTGLECQAGEAGTLSPRTKGPEEGVMFKGAFSEDEAIKKVSDRLGRRDY